MDVTALTRARPLHLVGSAAPAPPPRPAWHTLYASVVSVMALGSAAVWLAPEGIVQDAVTILGATATFATIAGWLRRNADAVARLPAR